MMKLNNQSMVAVAMVCLCALAWQSPGQPTPAPSDYQIPALRSAEFSPPFEVRSVSEKLLYVGTDAERIEANGKSYLAFSTVPEPVEAVLLEVQGNAVPYIEITKVGSTDFPDVIDEYQPGRFVYEHKGPGVYHVRSVDSDNRPVYTRFEIKSSDSSPPDDQPPTIDHDELAEIVRAMAPADPGTARAIADAYDAAIDDITDDMSLEEVRELVRAKREAAFMALPPLRYNWNAYLLASGKYLSGLESTTDYLAAIKVASDELKQVKVDTTSVTPSPPAVRSPEIIVEPRMIRRVWVPAGCDGQGHCWQGHWETAR